MVRSFVALLIPDEWAAYLGRVEQDLKERITGVSWVKPENLHFTLRFLGDLGDSGVKRAGEAVRWGTQDSEAFAARVGSLGGFPSLERPRVVWAGLSTGSEQASALARAVNEALRSDGFGPPDKPFRPHVTLGRVREGVRGIDALKIYAPPPPPAEAVLDRVALMKSDLHPAGARYTPLVEVRLRQPGP